LALGRLHRSNCFYTDAHIIAVVLMPASASQVDAIAHVA
jgi:hypothetical protein